MTTARVWFFRCSLSVDTLAAAWLITRFGGEGAEARFARRDPPDSALGERLCYDPDAWRESGGEGAGQSGDWRSQGGAATRFDAALQRLGLGGDPALQKLAAVVRDSDHRGDAPSPLAIALTALVQGWDLLPAPTGDADPAEARACQTLDFAAPVFDAIHANFTNILTGPSH